MIADEPGRGGGGEEIAEAVHYSWQFLKDRKRLTQRAIRCPNRILSVTARHPAAPIYIPWPIPSVAPRFCRWRGEGERVAKAVPAELDAPTCNDRKPARGEVGRVTRPCL